METIKKDKENAEEGEEAGGLTNLKEEAVKQEPTSVEELKEIKADLVKTFETKENLKEDNLIKLLKVLARKKMSIELLRDSGIGKILTRVAERPKGFFSDDNVCKDKAQNLQNQWRNVVAEEKRKKAIEEAAAKKKKEELEEMIKNLPYFTKDVKAAIESKDRSPAQLARNFILVLQRHPEDDLGRPTIERLIKCAHIGLDLSEMFIQINPDERKRTSKFIALKNALDKGNPVLRRKLVQGIVSVNQLVKFSELELASEEVQKKRLGIQEYEFQANRTDALFAQEKEQNMGSAMYECTKCGSTKVTCYTQQTRGADEPMTEFYNCLDCGQAWRECP